SPCAATSGTPAAIRAVAASSAAAISLSLVTAVPMAVVSPASKRLPCAKKPARGRLLRCYERPRVTACGRAPGALRWRLHGVLRHASSAARGAVPRMPAAAMRAVPLLRAVQVASSARARLAARAARAQAVARAALHAAAGALRAAGAGHAAPAARLQADAPA